MGRVHKKNCSSGHMKYDMCLVWLDIFEATMGNELYLKDKKVFVLVISHIYKDIQKKIRNWARLEKEKGLYFWFTVKLERKTV